MDTSSSVTNIDNTNRPHKPGNVDNVVNDFKQLDNLLNKAVLKKPSSTKATESIREVGREIIETRCEYKYDRNLNRVAVVGGIPVFEEEHYQMKEEHYPITQDFVSLLKALAEVFGVKKPGISII